MRTELEIEPLAAAPPLIARRPRKPKRPSWVWVAAGAVVLLLGAIALLSPSSSRKRTEQVVSAGASSRSIAISPDGTLLAVGLLDGSIRILNAQSGKTLARFKAPDPQHPLAPVSALTFGPGNCVLVLRANDSKLYIFSRDLQVQTERSLHPNAHDVVWSATLMAR